MIRILYNIDDIQSKGGTQRVTIMKANYFAEQEGYEVFILVQKEYGLPAAFPLNEKIKVRKLEVSDILYGRIIPLLSLLKGIFSFSVAFRNAIREIRPDIVITVPCNANEFFLPFLCGKAKSIREYHYSKEMAHINALNTPRMKRIYFNAVNTLYQHTFRFYDRFVALTKKDLEAWHLPNGIVITNPIETDHSTLLTYHQKQVIAVGRYVYQKGFDLLMPIWKKVILHHPDWRLAIYGPGDKTECCQVLNSYGLEGSVTLHDAVPDIGNKYLESSIFVFPSRFEGFGLVLAEAMATGLPAIAFDCPCGPSDIISDEQNGYLIRPGNNDAFADKLALLMENEELRKQLGEKARIGMSKFEKERIMKCWEELFHLLT